MTSSYKRQRFERPRGHSSITAEKRLRTTNQKDIDYMSDLNTQDSLGSDDLPPSSPKDFWWFGPSTPSSPPPLTDELNISILGYWGKTRKTLPPVPPNTLRIFLNSKKNRLNLLNPTNIRPYSTSSSSSSSSLEGPTLWNMWQFSMVYSSVYTLSISCPLTGRLIWDQQHAIHLDACGNVLPAFWEWRKAGWSASESILQPNGPFHTEVGAQYCLWPKALDDSMETDIVSPLDGQHFRRYYSVAARSLFAKEYLKAIEGHPSLTILREMIKDSGMPNIQLVDRHFTTPDQMRMHAREAGIFLQPECESLLLTHESLKSMLYAHQIQFSYTLALGALLSKLESSLFIY